jgi:hypothetical protein
MRSLLRSRVARAAASAVLLVGLTIGAAVAVGRLSGTTGVVPAGAVPGVLQTPGSGSCVARPQAEQIWTDVNARLDALVLHPSLSGVDAVAQGTAAVQTRAYIQQRLLDNHLTEREKSRLDDLSIVQPACGAQPLTVRVTATLVQDDYLAADGHVDHQDPGVGQASHLLESFVRSGAGGWKLVTIASLDQSPSPGTVV